MIKFTLTKHNYIVCPKCKNDSKFGCFGERVDNGIFSIRIQCRKCKWVSDELYEETGSFPDLCKEKVQTHIWKLHDMQQEEPPQGGEVKLLKKKILEGFLYSCALTFTMLGIAGAIMLVGLFTFAIIRSVL